MSQESRLEVKVNNPSKLANIGNQYREYKDGRIYSWECMINCTRILVGKGPWVYNDVTRSRIRYEFSNLFPKE